MPRQKFGTLYTVHLCYGKDHTHLVTEVSSKKTLQTRTQNVLSETTIGTRPHRKARSHPESCMGSLWTLEQIVWLLGWRRVERTKERDIGLMLPIGWISNCTSRNSFLSVEGNSICSVTATCCFRANDYQHCYLWKLTTKFLSLFLYPSDFLHLHFLPFYHF